jgi:hypothetical protein
MSKISSIRSLPARLTDTYPLLLDVQIATTPLLSSLRPRTSSHKVETLSLTSHLLIDVYTPRRSYPILSIPFINSLVIRCDKVRGPDSGGWHVLHHILHEFADFISSLRPSSIVFQSVSYKESPCPDFFGMDSTAWSAVVDCSSSSEGVSITFVSSVFVPVEGEWTTEGERRRWTWGYPSLSEATKARPAACFSLEDLNGLATLGGDM